MEPSFYVLFFFLFTSYIILLPQTIVHFLIFTLFKFLKNCLFGSLFLEPKYLKLPYTAHVCILNKCKNNQF